MLSMLLTLVCVAVVSGSNANKNRLLTLQRADIELFQQLREIYVATHTHSNIPIAIVLCTHREHVNITMHMDKDCIATEASAHGTDITSTAVELMKDFVEHIADCLIDTDFIDNIELAETGDTFSFNLSTADFDAQCGANYDIFTIDPNAFCVRAATDYAEHTIRRFGAVYDYDENYAYDAGDEKFLGWLFGRKKSEKPREQKQERVVTRPEKATAPRSGPRSGGVGEPTDTEMVVLYPDQKTAQATPGVERDLKFGLRCTLIPLFCPYGICVLHSTSQRHREHVNISLHMDKHCIATEASTSAQGTDNKSAAVELMKDFIDHIADCLIDTDSLNDIELADTGDTFSFNLSTTDFDAQCGAINDISTIDPDAYCVRATTDYAEHSFRRLGAVYNYDDYYAYDARDIDEKFLSWLFGRKKSEKPKEQKPQPRIVTRPKKATASQSGPRSGGAGKTTDTEMQALYPDQEMVKATPSIDRDLKFGFMNIDPSVLQIHIDSTMYVFLDPECVKKKAGRAGQHPKDHATAMMDELMKEQKVKECFHEYSDSPGIHTSEDLDLMYFLITKNDPSAQCEVHAEVDHEKYCLEDVRYERLDHVQEVQHPTCRDSTKAHRDGEGDGENMVNPKQALDAWWLEAIETDGNLRNEGYKGYHRAEFNFDDTIVPVYVLDLNVDLAHPQFAHLRDKKNLSPNFGSVPVTTDPPSFYYGDYGSNHGKYVIFVMIIACNTHIHSQPRRCNDCWKTFGRNQRSRNSFPNVRGLWVAVEAHTSHRDSSGVLGKEVCMSPTATVGWIQSSHQRL